MFEHIDQIKSLAPRGRVRALMRRTNSHALLFLTGHAVAIGLTGMLVYRSLGTAWVLLAMFLHGLGIVHLFSAQHEFAHRTAFKLRSLNDYLGWIFGVIILLPQIYFRWEHTAHHTYTQDTKRDPQLIAQPGSIGGYLYYLSTIPYWLGFLRPFVRHLRGIITREENHFLPKSERWKVIWEARAMLAIYAGVFALGYAFHVTHWILDYWLLPRLLAEPYMRFIRMTEHVGRPVDHINLLENTRTVRVFAPLRWLAWNMPYHAEHHLSPSIPFHALPALHREIQRQPRIIARGYRGANAEIVRLSLRGAGPAVAKESG